MAGSTRHIDDTAMLSIQAEQENGTTTPVVPRTDRPPTTPSRGFQVRAASCSPPSTPISTTASGAVPCLADTSCSASTIIRRAWG